MSKQYQCQSCKATYADRMPDGTVYMHACGPVLAADGFTPLARPGGRDERPVLDRLGRFTGIVSEGSGVNPTDGKDPAEPAWLLASKADLARREASEDA